MAKNFFYCPANGYPCIQVGGGVGDIAFWLKYNNEEINRCSSYLIKTKGKELAISDIDAAKELLLDFCSDAFNRLDADFFAINNTSLSIDSILSTQHREGLYFMFDEFLSSRKQRYPYTFTLPYTILKGTIELNKDITVFGGGEYNCLLSHLDSLTSFKWSKSLNDDKDIIREPICRYARTPTTSIVLIKARTKQEAVNSLNKFFGALCLSIDSPFRINQLTVDNRINSFIDGSLISEQFRVNLPSVYEIEINDIVKKKLMEIYSLKNKRVNSMLSFVAHGWTHDSRERFLNHFIALDALYGKRNGNQNRSSILKGLVRHAKEIKDIESKFDAIYQLRCKFVHGEITSFSDDSKYTSYIEKHGTDPLLALFDILKECILNYGRP
ncbi:hypothetical protein C9980_25630 [Vibrio mediterranei]|nr:hypothetical protein C9980_25630 [Vibrio mediterranei]